MGKKLKCGSLRICLFCQVYVKRNYFFLKHPTMILSFQEINLCGGWKALFFSTHPHTNLIRNQSTKLV